MRRVVPLVMLSLALIFFCGSADAQDSGGSRALSAIKNAGAGERGSIAELKERLVRGFRALLSGRREELAETPQEDVGTEGREVERPVREE
ncbi:MAG: hypothetical protein HYY14_00805 [Candidatus Omnitrophica bacterium]|nr:hypothetical protein [Candidatus Omnitrophota bacterium]